MTRPEAEAKILGAMLEIDAVLKEYCPGDGFLSAMIYDGDISFYNVSKDRPINYFARDVVKK